MLNIENPVNLYMVDFSPELYKFHLPSPDYGTQAVFIHTHDAN